MTVPALLPFASFPYCPQQFDSFNDISPLKMKETTLNVGQEEWQANSSISTIVTCMN